MPKLLSGNHPSGVLSGRLLTERSVSRNCYRCTRAVTQVSVLLGKWRWRPAFPKCGVEQGKMAGPFQWDGWTSKWHSGTSQIKCFQVPLLHPNRMLLCLASSSTGLTLLLLTSPGHEDLSSIGFARLSTPQTPSTFQPKIRIWWCEAFAHNQEIQILSWRGSFIPSYSFSSILVSFEEERVVNPRDSLSSWLFKVCLVLSCIHAHHLTANSCLGGRFTNPLLLRLRNTTLLGSQVASHLWELGYGCVIDRMPADHPPVSRSMPWYRPLWEPLVSFFRSLASVLVWGVILNSRDSLLLWLKKKKLGLWPYCVV